VDILNNRAVTWPFTMELTGFVAVAAEFNELLQGICIIFPQKPVIPCDVEVNLFCDYISTLIMLL